MASTAHPEATTSHPEASTAHPEAASTTPTAEETLDELLRDAPRNAEARARQEAAWDLQGKEDARRLLYEREVAARHARLLAASINAFWRAEALAQGHGQGCIPLPKETVALIGEFAEPTAHLVDRGDQSARGHLGEARVEAGAAVGPGGGFAHRGRAVAPQKRVQRAPRRRREDLRADTTYRWRGIGPRRRAVERRRR